MKRKYSDLNKNINLVLKISIALCLISTVILIIFSPYENSSVSIDDSNHYIDSEVIDSNIVEQTFISKFRNIEKISVLFFNYERSTKGCSFIIKVKDENNKIIEQQQIDTTNIEDRKYHDFKFKKLKNVKGKKLVLVIESKGCKKKKNTLSYCINSKANENQFINEGGIVRHKSMTFKYAGKKTNRWYSWYPLTLGLMLYSIYIVIKKERRGNKNVKKK